MASTTSPPGDGPEPGRRLYSQTQAAAIFRVHRNTLAKWLGEGAPAVTRADRERGVEWELDISDIVDWRISRAVEDAVANLGGDRVNVTKDQADTRRAVAMAIKAEVEADEAIKAVVYRHDVETDLGAFCQVLRTGLGNASSTLASRASTMTSAPEIEDLCHAELNRAFEGAKAELDARWASDLPRDGDELA